MESPASKAHAATQVFLQLNKIEHVQDLRIQHDDHFDLVGAGYLCVLHERNGPSTVCPNDDAAVIRSLATPAAIACDIVPMQCSFLAQ